ncbi:MAG TPA: aldo/keto reductase [Anaerolineae bacterium]|nr:aldo/keto reductase [Anaerolineae bacterium]
MKKRSLGKSDVEVSPIGLGCWQFSQEKNIAGRFWGFLEYRQIKEIVSSSLECGINWFDTAEVYGNGASERALANALSELNIKPGKVIIATKWMPALRFASSIVGSINKRQEALHPYPIDLYQIHNPFSFSSIKSQMKAMAQLVRQGKVRFVGVSNFSAEDMRRADNYLSAEGLALISNQIRFSLLDRSIEENGVLDMAKELGVIIIAYSPLAQGLLTGKFHDDSRLIGKRSGFRKFMKGFRKEQLKRTQPLIDVLHEVALSHNATLAQIALSWAITFHGQHIIAIPGATNVRQAKQNAEAMQIDITEKELSRLDQASRAVIL